MLAARANWKGNQKFGEINSPVALCPDAGTGERISFNTINVGQSLPRTAKRKPAKKAG